MRIAVLDDYQRVAHQMADWSALSNCSIDFLHDVLQSAEDVVSRLGKYDIAVAMRERTKFPAAVLSRLSRLRLLITTGMINRSIDLTAAAEHGIIVCGTPWTDLPTVEVTWGLILSVAHAIPKEDTSLRALHWQSAVGHSLCGKTLGIIGLGRIGSQVARVGQAFGMKVIAFSPHLTIERAEAAGAVAVSKDELFRQSDVVSVHLILSQSTRGIVGAAELALMKPTALIVNTARGPLLDEKALADALNAGRLAGAGIDVYSDEPIQKDNPLLAAPNTVLTPHIGYVTYDVYRAWYSAVIEDIQAFMNGQPIRKLN